MAGPRLASLLLIVLVGCAAPAISSPSDEGLASASPGTSTSAPVSAEANAPVPEAPPASASASPDGQVEIDALVSTAVDRLRIREEPGLGGASLGTLYEGAISYVLSGPVSADGFEWYLVSSLGIPQASGCITPIQTDPYDCPAWLGWAAAHGPEGDPWLVPGTIDCPTWPSPVMAEDFVFGVPWYGYLACFGDDVRSIVGFYPKIPDPPPDRGGACGFDTGDLVWIGCNLGYERIVLDAAADFFGPGLVLTIDPASGVQMPMRGQWIEVTGRYDHPAAQGCTWGDPPEASVFGCRSRFVVESVRAVDAP